MRLVAMTCPTCGARINVPAGQAGTRCQFCGTQVYVDDEVQRVEQHIRYDNAEETGYSFEKGRQRAKMESSQAWQQASAYPSTGWEQPQQFTQPKKKSVWKMVLWGLGWLCMFPVPLTILMLRKKDISQKVRVGTIVGAWAVYLMLAGIGAAMPKDTIDDTKTAGQEVAAVTDDAEEPAESKVEVATESEDTETDDDAEEEVPLPSNIEVESASAWINYDDDGRISFSISATVFNNAPYRLTAEGIPPIRYGETEVKGTVYEGEEKVDGTGVLGLLKDKAISKEHGYGTIKWSVYCVPATGQGVSVCFDENHLVYYSEKITSAFDEQNAAVLQKREAKAQAEAEWEAQRQAEAAEREAQRQAEEAAVVYPDNKSIDAFVRAWNATYPEMALTSESLEPYYHHGSTHKEQVKTTLNGAPVTVSMDFFSHGPYGVSVFYNGHYDDADTATANRELFRLVMRVALPSLSDEEIQARWQEVINNGSRAEWDDGLSVETSGQSESEGDGSFTYMKVYV